VEGGIKIKVTVADIGSQTGLDEAQVNEVLDKIVKAKLGEVQSDCIVVADVDKLRKFLEFLALKEQFGEL